MPLLDSIIKAIHTHLENKKKLHVQADGQIFKWDPKQKKVIDSALCTLDSLSGAEDKYFKDEGIRRDLVWLKIFQAPNLSERFMLLSFAAICKSNSTELKYGVTKAFVKEFRVMEREVADVAEKNAEFRDFFEDRFEPSDIAMSLFKRANMNLSPPDIAKLVKIDTDIKKFNVAIDSIVENAKADINTMLDKVAGLDQNEAISQSSPAPQ